MHILLEIINFNNFLLIFVINIINENIDYKELTLNKYIRYKKFLKKLKYLEIKLFFNLKMIGQYLNQIINGNKSTKFSNTLIGKSQI